MPGNKFIINKMISLKIIKPVFKCKEDENIFLMRLAEVSFCEKIIDKDNYFVLVSKTSDSQLMETQVQEICDIWNSSYKITR